MSMSFVVIKQAVKLDVYDDYWFMLTW